MSYCINPHCKARDNPESTESCQSCGTPLLVQQRYQLVSLIRPLDGPQGVEIFEVIDQTGGEGVNPDTHQIMKVLPVVDGGATASKQIEFIRREAKILKEISHFAIPKVQRDGFFVLKESETAPELYCLVQQKFEGQTLDLWLEEHDHLTQELALDWLEQLCDCLHEVHTLGYFHRDIKPANIILQPNGSLALIDFGAVRKVTNTYLAKVSSEVDHDPDLEVTGIWTIGYAPPEQINGKAVPQSDFYALGCTFVHLLTGIHPRQLPSDMNTGQLLWRDKSTVDKNFGDFLDELMAAVPGKRPQNTETLRSHFKQTFYGKSKRFGVFRDKRLRVGLGILIFLGLCTWGSFQWFRQGQFTYVLEEGILAFNSGEWGKAQSSFEQAVSIDPRNDEAHYYLALTCIETTKKDCAKHFKEAIRLAPQTWQNYYGLGTLYEETGQYALAKQQYITATELAPDAPEPANNLARLLILEGDYDTATKIALKALSTAKRPVFRAALLKNLGWAALQEKRVPDAQRYLKEAVQLDPERPDTHCLLSQITPTTEYEEACLSLPLPSEQVEVRQWRRELIERLSGKK